MAAAAIATGSVQAQTQVKSLEAQQIFEQFNVVVLENMVTNNHVDGRTFVNGAVIGSNKPVFAMHPQDMPASNYAGLTVLGKGLKPGQAAVNDARVIDYGAVVYGNITNSEINNGASAIYGASINTSYNGGSTVYARDGISGGNVANKLTEVAPGSLQAINTAAATSTDFKSKLTALSTSMKDFGPTKSTVDVGSNRVTFNAGVYNGIAVFDLTGYGQDFFQKEFQFNLNGATSVYINSDLTSGTINANFLGGSAQSAGKSLIWNFYKATDLTINAQFGGNILAVNADLVQNQNIEGGVFVKNLDSRAEIHLNPFIGAVPEPETYAMMIAGLGLMGFMARRRKKA